MLKQAFSVLCLVALSSAHARAQDTFSIVAVDPATGEVGSAGASCVGAFDVSQISDLHPGVGAINTQAWYLPANQLYAGGLMAQGLAPSMIIDSLLVHDAQDEPARRQYGIAALLGGGSTAGHTGEFTDDYKGHLLGATYAVQGNILLGPQILDSIAARFERATGPLADRLMYAILGGRVVGADTRCAPLGTSSTGAFLRVARPGDRRDSIMLHISVSSPTGSIEPLDSLQRRFDAWKVAAVESDAVIQTGSVRAEQSGESLRVHVTLARRGDVGVALVDVAGRVVTSHDAGELERGGHVISLPSPASTGVLFVRVTAAGQVVTSRVALR
jgi:uncharacterized Ntn-hydrolase superfamily protein